MCDGAADTNSTSSSTAAVATTTLMKRVSSMHCNNHGWVLLHTRTMDSVCVSFDLEWSKLALSSI